MLVLNYKDVSFRHVNNFSVDLIFYQELIVLYFIVAEIIITTEN